MCTCMRMCVCVSVCLCVQANLTHCDCFSAIILASVVELADLGSFTFDGSFSCSRHPCGSFETWQCTDEEINWRLR